MMRFGIFTRHWAAGARPRAIGLSAAGLALAMTLCACGSADAAAGSAADSGSTSTASSAGSDAETVTLITHDSFAVDPDVLAAFEKSAGLTVQVLAQGDAGEMLSKVILTKDNPLGDAVFGIDNTFASKALDANIVIPYSSANASNGSDKYALGNKNLLTAVDFGDVCVNIDHEYFSKHNLTEPATFADLAKPEYKGMLVTEDAATSSPGLAFLFATIAHFGADGWQQYWQSLIDNGVKVDAGWTDAYTIDFSGSTGDGDRPLVVSYASSPPSEVPSSADTAPTGALLDTCFRQVEYAGVLKGAQHSNAAKKLIDFLLSAEFQQQIPGTMWMYPVDSTVALPDDWAKYAPIASDPATLDPADIDAHRQQWIADFSDLIGG